MVAYFIFPTLAGAVDPSWLCLVTYLIMCVKQYVSIHGI